MCVDNCEANVAAGTVYTLLEGKTAWLQRQHGLLDRTQSLECRSHGGGGRVSLDSGAGSGEGLSPAPSIVGRILFFFLAYFHRTQVPKMQVNVACGNARSQAGRKEEWFSSSCRGVSGCRPGSFLHRCVEKAARGLQRRPVDCYLYGRGASKYGNGDLWPHTSKSSRNIGPFITRDTNMPRDPVTGYCSAAPVENSQFLMDGRQQIDVVFRRIVMEYVQ